MELTTTFQKIADGETKQFGGSTGKLELWAKYNSQDIANNRSNVTVELRLVCSSYIGNYQATYWSISGSLSNSGDLGSGNYYSRTLGSATGNVLHEIDGTKTVSFSGNFNPTAWGMSISVSGSATLPSLHKPPTVQTADMTETDETMISLGVPNTTIVQYLSKKTITLHGTAEDSATLTYRLEHFGTNYNIPSTGYQASNVFNTDYTQNNVSISTDGKANIIQKLKDSLNGETTDWVYVDIGGVVQKPNGIAYTKPAIERTSTSIKRKSGNGTNLTDNKVSLNLKATFYKVNDVIGNYNSITQIGYKIWATDDTEPVNYTTLTPTISGGDITINNLEISNIVFTKVYNYKIIVTDNYGYSDTIVDGRVPIGVSLWTEYKDHVDFLSATIGGYAIADSGTGYIKFYDGTMICWGSKSTGTITWAQDGSIYYSAGFTFDDFAETFASAPIVLKTIQNTNQSRMLWITGNSAPTITNAGTYNLATYWDAVSTTVTASYIAIGKWR